MALTLFKPRPHPLFRHPRTHLEGGCPPAHLSHLAKELRSKDGRKFWDVLNPAIADFTTVGYILTFPGQVKTKNVAFRLDQLFANNIWTTKCRDSSETPSHSSRQDAPKHMLSDPKRSIWKFNLGLGQMTWPDKWPRYVMLHIGGCVMRQIQWHLALDF